MLYPDYGPTSVDEYQQQEVEKIKEFFKNTMNIEDITVHENLSKAEILKVMSDLKEKVEAFKNTTKIFEAKAFVNILWIGPTLCDYECVGMSTS